MAQFESRSQILLLFTGAFFISFLIHMFIVAEAKRRFGDSDAEKSSNNLVVSKSDDPSLWSRMKEKVRHRLITWLKKDETTPQDVGGQRKARSVNEDLPIGPYSLLHTKHDEISKPNDSERKMTYAPIQKDYKMKETHNMKVTSKPNDKLDFQRQVYNRIGGDRKMILDVLHAFCECTEVDEPPQENETSPTEETSLKEEEDSKNSTLNLLQKALSDSSFAKKLIMTYDICGVDGWVYIIGAIVLTCIFNYTLVLCCCLCFYKRRSKIYTNCRRTSYRPNKGKKMDYLDADFVETDKFLLNPDDKKGTP